MEESSTVQPEEEPASAATSTPAPKPAKPKLKALVERDACTGCEYCVNWCPVPDCLIMREGENVQGVLQIVHVNIETCIGCKLCEQYCPYDAIHIHKLSQEEMDKVKPLDGVISQPYRPGSL